MNKGYANITQKKIDWLEAKGLIVVIKRDDDQPQYIITARGLEYLNG